MSFTGLQYKIKTIKCDLITQKDRYDLTDLLEFVHLYSSMDDYFSTLEIFFTDTHDAVAQWKMNFNDKLEIVLKDPDGKIWKRTYRLMKIDDETPINLTTKGRLVSLFFVPEMLFNNLKTTISKYWKKTRSGLFSEIVKKYLIPDVSFSNESADDTIIDFWSNYFHPFDILDFLLTQIKDTYYDFVFFDDLTKFRLTSLSKLAEQIPKYEMNLSMENIKKVASSENIHAAKVVNNMDVIKLFDDEGLGNIFYKSQRPNYGYKRKNISPREVTSHLKMIDFPQPTNLYPKQCCDNFRGNVILSMYDCKSALYKTGNKAFWDWNYLEINAKGLLDRKIGEMVKMHVPKIGKGLNINPYYDGKWIIFAQKTSIMKNGETAQSLKMVKDDRFRNQS